MGNAVKTIRMNLLLRQTIFEHGDRKFAGWLLMAGAYDDNLEQAVEKRLLEEKSSNEELNEVRFKSEHLIDMFWEPEGDWSNTILAAVCSNKKCPRKMLLRCFHVYFHIEE